MQVTKKNQELDVYRNIAVLLIKKIWWQNLKD